ncbi:hypothetical protein AAMO2058_001028300 [Amorphochlora amoebiformis]
MDACPAFGFGLVKSESLDPPVRIDDPFPTSDPTKILGFEVSHLRSSYPRWTTTIPSGLPTGEVMVDVMQSLGLAFLVGMLFMIWAGVRRQRSAMTSLFGLRLLATEGHGGVFNMGDADEWRRNKAMLNKILEMQNKVGLEGRIAVGELAGKTVKVIRVRPDGQSLKFEVEALERVDGDDVVGIDELKHVGCFKKLEHGSIKICVELDKDQVQCCVCYEALTGKIYHCQLGSHNICDKCKSKINQGSKPGMCPIDRTPGGFVRNILLENQIRSITRSCVNSSRGCNIRTFPWLIESHQKDCKLFYSKLDKFNCPICRRRLRMNREDLHIHLKSGGCESKILEQPTKPETSPFRGSTRWTASAEIPADRNVFVTVPDTDNGKLIIIFQHKILGNISQGIRVVIFPTRPATSELEQRLETLAEERENVAQSAISLSSTEKALVSIAGRSFTLPATFSSTEETKEGDVNRISQILSISKDSKYHCYPKMELRVPQVLDSPDFTEAWIGTPSHRPTASTLDTKAKGGKQAGIQADKKAHAIRFKLSMQQVYDRLGTGVGGFVDCLDTVQKWHVAKILKRDEGCLLVHYAGFDTKWDEWIPLNSDRLAPLGVHEHVTHPALVVLPQN